MSKSMFLKGTILAASVFSICAALAAPTWAKEIPIIPPDKVEAGCKANGGVYMPPKNGAYGCISGNKGGTITVCGGQTEQHKKTCTQALVQGMRDKINMGQRLLSRN
jgi:hypothetical protein